MSPLTKNFDPVATKPDAAQMTRIVRAEVHEVAAKFVTPYRVTEGLLVSTRAIMLRLTDADGVEGWGEANPSKTFTGESVEDALDALRSTILPVVLQLAHAHPGPVDQILDATLDEQFCAKGAVSMALWDILGKRLNAPVSALLGGALRETIPVLWPVSSGTSDDDIRIIEERVAQGFTHFMLKMGSAPVRDDILRIGVLERHFGSTIRLIADANQGWTRAQAGEFVEGVKGSILEFIEQPLARDDVVGMKLLTRKGAILVSADEAIVGLPQAARMASHGAANVFSIKSSKNGGPLRAQKVAAVAEAFGIDCYMNSMHEFGITQVASLQHAATIRNLFDFGHAFMSTLRLAEDPTNFSSFVKDGVVRLPTAPGLGIDVDGDHVASMTKTSFRLER